MRTSVGVLAARAERVPRTLVPQDPPNLLPWLRHTETCTGTGAGIGLDVNWLTPINAEMPQC